MRVLASAAQMRLAAQPVAAAATRPSSIPTSGGPHSSSFAFQANSTPGPITPSSQPVYEGSVVLEGVKIAAVCLALLALAWRLWGILKNTDAGRNLLVLLGGADPAAQPDEGPAAHGLLKDGDPAEGLELSLWRAPAPAETSAATETQLAISTREWTWTTTSSSMSTRESHYSQPASTRSASALVRNHVRC